MIKERSIPYKFLSISVCLAGLVYAGLVAASPVTLSFEDIKKIAKPSPERLASEMELKISETEYKRFEARNYWEVFGGIGLSRNTEVLNDSNDRDYSSIDGRIGLTYPLLGSKERMTKEKVEAYYNYVIQIIKSDASVLKSNINLRESYINYWALQKKIWITKQYLQDEKVVLEKLSKRVEKGFLLAPDYHEFVSAFELAKRDLALFESEKEVALSNIRYYSGIELPEFAAEEPALFQLCWKNDNVKYNFKNNRTNSSLLVMAKELEKEQRLGELTNWDGVGADFTVAQSLGYETNPDGDKHSLSASLNFRMPISVIKYNRFGKEQNANKIERARFLYGETYKKLKQEAIDIFGWHESRKSNLRFANERANASNSRLRQEELRIKHLDGDVIEKLVAAKNNVYRTSIDFQDAKQQLYVANNRLRRFFSANCEPSEGHSEQHGFAWYKHKTEARVGIPKGFARTDHLHNRHKTGVYVWDSRKLFQKAEECPDYLSKLYYQGIGRLLISFDAEQIESQDLILRVNKFIRKANEEGIDVDLLLGEPTWILPKGREKLLKIIEILENGSFSKIHLDIEPDQIDSSVYEKEYIEQEFIKTIEAVKKKSAWPVAISIHHRYSSRKEIMDAIVSAGVTEVAMMIYISDREKVATIAHEPIINYPAIDFSIAQSVEKGLGINNSYFSLGKERLLYEMNMLKAEMVFDNFSGIIIQSWSDYEDIVNTSE